MKQKINIRLVAIAVLAALATMLGLTVVYYNWFQEQVKKDLRIEARLLSAAGMKELQENEAIVGDPDVRITWVSEDGTVLYDNQTDAGKLSNHRDRPEIAAAFATGEGESVRDSDTMNLRTFYYAMAREDGTVLRVAMEARSEISVFVSAIPVMLIVLVVILGVCIWFSHLLTRQLMDPIREMAENLDHISGTSAYKELAPFVDRIREQHEDILAAAKSRQDFTASVSHELKTPITAISGYAELICLDIQGDPEKAQNQAQILKFANDIRRNADRLVSLVNDIIRLSELDQSEKMQDFGRVDFYEVAEERMELLREVARKKNVTLTLSGGPCEISSNRTLLTELIDNLVQNAIRYNVFDGKVDVQVQLKKGHGVLTVSDTGIGIPKADQARIFERFYRVDKSRSRETGGTGLGLAIVKHIVEIHDGTIKVDSEPGKGTRITVEL